MSSPGSVHSPLAARPRRPRGEVTMGLGVVAVAAGVCVLAASLVGSGSAEHRHLTDGLSDHVRDVGIVAAMTVVMMGPFAAPLATSVARATVWWRARRAATAAVVAYLGVWVVVATALHVVGELLAAVVTPVGAVAGLTVVTAGEQLSRSRDRVLGACRTTRPVRAAHVWRGALAWGATAGIRCVRACLLPMALMAAQPGVVSFVGVTVLLWAERFGRRPRPRAWLAAGYVLVGVVQSIGIISQR